MFRHRCAVAYSSRVCNGWVVQYRCLPKNVCSINAFLDFTNDSAPVIQHLSTPQYRLLHHGVPTSTSVNHFTKPNEPRGVGVLDETIQPFGGILTDRPSLKNKASKTSTGSTVGRRADDRQRGPYLYIRPSEIHQGNKLWRTLRQFRPFVYNQKGGMRKVDLSFFNARKYEEAGKGTHTPVGIFKSAIRDRNNLSRITADFLQHVQADSGNDAGEIKYPLSQDDVLLSIFSDTNVQYLRKRGYDVEDVLTWSWILSSQTANAAATKISVLNKNAPQRDQRTLPVFVITQLLRAQSMSAKSLDALLHAAERSFRTHSSYDSKLESMEVVSQQTAVILIVRFLRHARDVAPQLLEKIADLTCSWIHGKTNEGHILEPKEAQSICYIYNRVLSLFSLPTSLTPFRVIPIQQRAQFRLLRKMMEFKPQLPVTREGYRALVKVQIAHRKLDDERKWALAKAASWPPWRKNKLGIDQDIEHVGQTSRAREVLTRQNAAGYTHLQFEKAAQVVAGWDADKSPTIQKRAIIPRAMLHWLQSTFSNSVPAESQADHLIWTARINATRTVREAWSCFCSYDVEISTDHRTMDPYQAMFEKLFAKTHVPTKDTKAVPGDGKEVYEEPISSRDQIYVPSEPPSIKVFYEKMLHDKVKPAGRLLASLMDHAQSLEEGLQYIQDSRFNELRRDLLLNAHKYSQSTVRDIINNLPDYFLAAFVRLLGRFSTESERQWFLPRGISVTMLDQDNTDLSVVDARTYVYHLLDISGTRYTPAWNALLQMNKTYRTKAGEVTRSRFEKGVDFRKIQDRMYAHAVHPDSSTFMISFSHFEDIILGRNLTQVAWTYHIKEHVTAVFEVLGRIKRIFATAVGMEDHGHKVWLSCSANATIGSMPHTIVLQMLVSLLGCGHDFNGIIDVLKWMDRFSIELNESLEEGNGMKHLRHTLILARYFLERKSYNDEYQPSDNTGEIEVESYLQEAQDIIARNASWGGWPTEDEIYEYRRSRESWFKRIERVSALVLSSMNAKWKTGGKRSVSLAS